MADTALNPLRRGRNKRMYIINQHNEGDSSFKITIDTSLGTGTNITLPLPSGETYNFWWTPGDGSAARHVTAYNDVNATYDYGVPFSGQASIGVSPGDKCGGWSFNDGGDKLKITSVDKWGTIGFDYLRYGFFGCANLLTVAGELSISGNLQSMFQGCTSLTALDTSNWNTSGVTILTSFIQDCTNLTTLDVSNWDTSGVVSTGLVNFMRDAASITALDVSNWDVSQVTSLSGFAFGATALQTLDVSSWNISNVTYTGFFVTSCPNLVILDTTSWDTDNITNCIGMVGQCTSLTSSFTDTKWWNRTVPIGTFTNCFLNATNISNYASIPNNWKGL